MSKITSADVKSRIARFTRRAGDEPFEGYRLLAPLGIGGFGEVWKCAAPGGLLKAMKIVTVPILLEAKHPPAQFEQDSMERIKAVRHPFMIAVDRVNRIGDELFVVMELAETSLLDQFELCRSAGLLGIPADELLHYLLEAAEILDVMNFQHDLQHLDVKPANLLVDNRHVKLADFGLVSSVTALPLDSVGSPSRCFTPRYAAPELSQGSISRFSDQYSLAVVYQELLTGTLPFEGSSLLKRLLAAPDLAQVPETERPVVARALSPKPEDRFPSCLEFIHALLECHAHADASIYSRVMKFNSLAPVRLLPKIPPVVVDEERQIDTPNNFGPSPHESSPPTSLPPDSVETPSNYGESPAEGTGPFASPGSTLSSQATVAEIELSAADTIYPPTIHVSNLKWRGDRSGEQAPQLDDFIAQLIAVETGQADPSTFQEVPYRELPGEVIEHSFFIPAISSLSLRQRFEKLMYECRGQLIERFEHVLVFAVEAAAPFWKKYGVKQRILKASVLVDRPRQVEGDWLKVVARLEPLIANGPPLDSSVLSLRPLVLKNIRAVLQVAAERRVNKRFDCDFGVRLYPVLSEWRFDQVIEGRAVDLSANGVGLVLPREPLTSRYYIRPNAPNPLNDCAIMAQTARKRRLANGSIAVGAILGRL